jgi:hypothetical protein
VRRASRKSSTFSTTHIQFDAQLDVRELLRARNWKKTPLTIKKYRAVFAQGRGVAWPKAGTLNEQQSIQVTTAEQWARENLACR